MEGGGQQAPLIPTPPPARGSPGRGLWEGVRINTNVGSLVPHNKGGKKGFPLFQISVHFPPPIPPNREKYKTKPLFPDEGRGRIQRGGFCLDPNLGFLSMSLDSCPTGFLSFSFLFISLFLFLLFLSSFTSLLPLLPPCCLFFHSSPLDFKDPGPLPHIVARSDKQGRIPLTWILP